MRLYFNIICVIIISCLAQLIAIQTYALDDRSAQELYDIGEYRLASLKAEKLDTAEGYSLAVRAALVHGGHIARGNQAEEWLERAAELSEMALRLDSANWRNRLSQLLIVSYQGKQQRSVSLVKRAKRLIDELIKSHPDEAMVHAALAGWHSEISAAGILPRFVFGASRKVARRHFLAAIAIDDNKISIALEYAKFLSRGGKEDKGSAEKLLISIVEAEPQDAFERKLLENAAFLLKAVKTKKKKTIKVTIAQISSFPDF